LFVPLHVSVKILINNSPMKEAAVTVKEGYLRHSKAASVAGTDGFAFTPDDALKATHFSGVSNPERNESA
jgi:hypothetical protein